MPNHNSFKKQRRLPIFWVMACAGIWSLLFFSGCTFINKQTYEIQYSSNVTPDDVIKEVEAFFDEIGFRKSIKIHKTYPKKEKYVSYFLGERRVPVQGPFELYWRSDYVNLRLEESNELYIEWIRVSSHRQKPPPGYFDKFYEKVSCEVKKRLGTEIKFRLVDIP